MSKRFCPKCGSLESKENPILDVLCQRCHLKEHSLLHSYKQPKIIICSLCNSYLNNGKWNRALSDNPKENLSLIIEKILKERIKFAPEAEIKEMHIVTNPNQNLLTRKANIETELLVKGKIQSSATIMKETYNLPLGINFSRCKNCSKKSSQYYEAILQIRPYSEEVLDFINSFIETRKDASITKTVNIKGGTDLYFISQKFTSALVSKLRKKFPAEIKRSSKLYGQKKGKLLYRTTLLFRLKE